MTTTDPSHDNRPKAPKAPKAKVAPDTGSPDAAEKVAPAADAPVDGRQADPTEAGPEAECSQADDQATPSFSAAVESVGSWLRQNFPGHVNAVVFGFLGFVLAVMLFCIGLWQTLVIALLVACGVAFGQYLDGDPRIVRFVGRLFDNGTHTRRK